MTSYVFTPYGYKGHAFGKADLIRLENKSLTSADVENYYKTNYNINSGTWNKLFGSDVRGYNNPTVFTPIKSISGYTNQNNITVDLLNVDVTMQIMSKMEIALKNATNVYNLFKKAYSDKTYNNTVEATIYDIYKQHLNDESDLSLYKLQLNRDTSELSERRILFTTRLGVYEYGNVHRLSTLMNSPSKYREGQSLQYFARDFGIEMLQNSLLNTRIKRVNLEKTIDSIIESPLSCGFTILKKSDNTVENIRIYFSYILTDPTNDKISMNTNRDIVISCGVDLYDSIDITKFRLGLSSDTFLYFLANICLTLNRDTSSGFTNTSTKWEYDKITNFNSLKCIISDYASYWNNTLISKCYLRGSTIDIPNRMYLIIKYLNLNYSSLEDEQMILLPIVDGAYKIITIIRIINEGGRITFQNRDARFDNLFPIYNIKSDTVISGDLQVENYQGDTFMQVDPVTTTMTIMGKLGINQESHEIKGMVDIDNLSNNNMKHFIDIFSPFISDTIANMDRFITRNPYTNTEQTDSIATILPLRTYTTEYIPIVETRETRFGRLQARIELPVRMHTIVDAYNKKNAIDDLRRKKNAELDRLWNAYNKRVEEEEEAKKMAIVAEVAIVVGFAAIAAVTGGASMTVVFAAGAMTETVKKLQEKFGSLDTLIENLDGYTSEELQKKLDKATAEKRELDSASAEQANVIIARKSELSSQALILGLDAIYRDYLKAQSDFLDVVRFYALSIIFFDTSINEIIDKINEKIDTYNKNRQKSMHVAKVPKFIVKESYANDITALKTEIEELPNVISANYTTDIDATLNNTTMSVVITKYRETTKDISDSTELFITEMQNYSGYSNATGEAILFLKTYAIFIGEKLVTVQNSVKNQSEKVILDKFSYKTITTTTTQFINIEKELDDKQKEFDRASFYLDAYTWLINAFGQGLHSGVGDHHYVRGKCNLADGPVYEYHFDGMIQDANNARLPIFEDIGGYGDILSTVFGTGDMQLKFLSGWINSRFSNARSSQVTIVNRLKGEIDNLKTTMSSFQDELQEFTRDQNWTAETHNLIKSIITNWKIMFVNYPNETVNTTQAVILPITTIDENVTSILYLKASINNFNNISEWVSKKSALRDNLTNLELNESQYIEARTRYRQILEIKNLFDKYKKYMEAANDYAQGGNQYGIKRDEYYQEYLQIMKSTARSPFWSQKKNSMSYQKYQGHVNAVLLFVNDSNDYTRSDYRTYVGFLGTSSPDIQNQNLSRWHDQRQLNYLVNNNAEKTIPPGGGLFFRYAPNAPRSYWKFKIVGNKPGEPNTEYFILYTTDNYGGMQFLCYKPDMLSPQLAQTRYITDAIIFQTRIYWRYNAYYKSNEGFQYYYIEQLITLYDKHPFYTNYIPLSDDAGPDYYAAYYWNHEVGNYNWTKVREKTVDEKHSIEGEVYDRMQTYGTTIGNLRNEIRRQRTEIQSLENKFDNETTLTMYGRYLNIDNYTRDKSYRETLLKLINTLTAATQLVNYSCILFKNDMNNIVYDRIKSDAFFVDRFGESQFIAIDNTTDEKVVQNEQYPHWNNKAFSELFINGTNLNLRDIHNGINKAFIAQYGFDPLNAKISIEMLENIFIVPYNYDDIWRLYIMRFYRKDEKIYRISCVVVVTDYLSQSIISNGDVLFYGDLTVKTENKEEIFSIDTLNKTVNTMYPMAIGANHPKTMLDVQDTSIINIRNLYSIVTERLININKVIIPNSVVVDAFNNILPTEITSNTSNDHYYYVYEMDRNITDAGDIRIIYHGENPLWTDKTYQYIIDQKIDQDRSEIIEKNIIPTLQKILGEVLMYNGSLYITLMPFITGLKYSINRVIMKPDKIYIVGSGINVQHYNINVINNPNVNVLFKNIDDMIKYATYTMYKNHMMTDEERGYTNMTEYIYLLLSQNDLLESNSYIYTLMDDANTYLDHKVGNVRIRDLTKNVTPDKLIETEILVRFHTSFMVEYFKFYNSMDSNLFGIVSVRDNNHDYIAYFYKHLENSITRLRIFFVNITEEYMKPSVSINGDMEIAGELTLYNKHHMTNEKYITLNPANKYFGVNTNVRYINYTAKYNTTTSPYNSQHHAVVFSRTYPNLACQRVSEEIEDPLNPSYSRFRTYSSSTMTRVSELWTIDEIMDRVVKFNQTHSPNITLETFPYKLNLKQITDNETGNTYDNTYDHNNWPNKPVEYDEQDFDWRKYEGYGANISYEIKDRNGVSTELGAVRVAADFKDKNNNLHAGFGVHVSDMNMATDGEYTLKNIMYVNNQKQLFIDGIWLGGKLLRAEGDSLLWGNNPIILDTIVPTLSEVFIESNNTMDNKIGIEGDIITLTFKSSKAIHIPEVTFKINNIDIISYIKYTKISKNTWTASYIVNQNDSSGLVTYRIDFQDLAGNDGIPVTSGSGTVTIDRV